MKSCFTMVWGSSETAVQQICADGSLGKYKGKVVKTDNWSINGGVSPWKLFYLMETEIRKQPTHFGQDGSILP